MFILRLCVITMVLCILYERINLDNVYNIHSIQKLVKIKGIHFYLKDTHVYLGVFYQKGSSEVFFFFFVIV